jgi:TPR repeat protein
MGIDYLQRAADNDSVSEQLHSARMLRQGDVIARNQQQSAHYYRLVADQGSVEGQQISAECLIHGDGVVVNATEAERYLQLASSQGDCRAQLRYGIVLLSGLLGRFDFVEARNRIA